MSTQTSTAKGRGPWSVSRSAHDGDVGKNSAGDSSYHFPAVGAALEAQKSHDVDFVFGCGVFCMYAPRVTQHGRADDRISM